MIDNVIKFGAIYIPVTLWLQLHEFYFFKSAQVSGF